MKKLIMFTITLLVSVPVVLADVLPEYTTKEKLVGVEMTANVADYPEWVFFQRVANYDTNKLISELLGDDGTLGCNRSNYINELLAVKATSPEDKQYLIYEWNTHRKQLQQLINIQKSIEQLRNSYHYADWLDDALFDNLQIQIDNVHSHIENKEKDFLYFLASKGAIQLFSGKNFRELGCNEYEVVKKSFVSDKKVDASGLGFTEIKVNHLIITPEMLENGEKLQVPDKHGNEESVLEPSFDTKNNSIDTTDKKQEFWKGLLCFFKGIFGKTC